MLSQSVFCSQVNRIKLTNINFYSKNYENFNLNDTISKLGRVKIDYKMANRFSISYSVDSLSENEIIKYKIEGFDREWISDNGCRCIIATNLNAGSYQIKIGLFNANSKIEEVNFKLLITPPFWDTWLFRIGKTFLLFGIFIVIILVFAINNSRLRNKSKNIST
jgi:hypothetical protein